MALEPKTDREAMIELSGDIKSLRETIERFGKALIHLETKKVDNHEARLDELFLWKNEINGGWKLVLMASFILGAIATLLGIFKN